MVIIAGRLSGIEVHYGSCNGCDTSGEEVMCRRPTREVVWTELVWLGCRLSFCYPMHLVRVAPGPSDLYTDFKGRWTGSSTYLYNADRSRSLSGHSGAE